MQENILTSIAQQQLSEIFHELRQKYQPKRLTQEEKNAISDLNKSDIHLQRSVQEWLHTNKIVPFQAKHNALYQQVIDTYTQKKRHLLQNKKNANWPIIFALKDDITQKLLRLLAQLELSLTGINLNNLTDDTESAKNNRETLRKQLVDLLQASKKSSSTLKNQIAKAYRYLIALQSLNTMDPTADNWTPIIKEIDDHSQNLSSTYFFSEWLSALYMLSLHATKNDVYSSLSGQLTDEQIREEFLEAIVQALHDCYRAYNLPEQQGGEEPYFSISKPSCIAGSVGRLGKAVFRFSRALSVASPCTPSFSSEIEKYMEDVMVDFLKAQLIHQPEDAKTLLLTIEKIMARDEIELFPLQNFFNWADSASENYSQKHAQAIIQQITEDLLNTWTADLSDQDREQAFNDHLEATKQWVTTIFNNSARKFNAKVIGDSTNTQVSGGITDRMKFVAFQVIFNHSKETKQKKTQELFKSNPQYFLDKELPFFKDLLQVTGLLPFYFRQNGFLGTLALLRKITLTIPKEDELYLWSTFIHLSLANHKNFSLLEQSEKLTILTPLLRPQDPHEKQFQSHLINQLSISQFFELFNQLIPNQQGWQELASSSLMDALIQKALDHPADGYSLIAMRNELQKDGNARLSPNSLRQFQKEKVLPSIINKLKSEAKQGKNKLLNFLLDPTQPSLYHPVNNNFFIITEFLNALEPENLPLQPQSNEFTQEQRKQMDLNKDVLAPPLTPKNFMGIFGDSIFQYDVTQSSSTLHNLKEFKSLKMFRSLFLKSEIALQPDRLLNFLKEIVTSQANPQLIYFLIPLLKHPNSDCKQQSYQTLLLLCSQLYLKPIESHHELSIQTHGLLTVIENSLNADSEFSNLMTSPVFTQEEQILLKKQFSEMIAQQLMEADEKEKSDTILRFLLLDKTAFPNLNKIFKHTDSLFQEVLNDLSLEDFKRLLVNKPNIISSALTSSKLDFSQLQRDKQISLLIYLNDQPRINPIDWIPILAQLCKNPSVEIQQQASAIFYKRYLEFIAKRDEQGKLVILTDHFQSLKIIDSKLSNLSLEDFLDKTLKSAISECFIQEITTELREGRYAILKCLLEYRYPNSPILSNDCLHMIGAALTQLNPQELVNLFKSTEPSDPQNAVLDSNNLLSKEHMISLQHICLYEDFMQNTNKEAAQEIILNHLDNQLELNLIQLKDWIIFLSPLLNPQYLPFNATIKAKAEKIFNQLYQHLLNNQDFSQLCELHNIIKSDHGGVHKKIMNDRIQAILSERLQKEITEGSMPLLKYLLNHLSVDPNAPHQLMDKADEAIRSVLEQLDPQYLIQILHPTKDLISKNANEEAPELNFRLSLSEALQLSKIYCTLSKDQHKQILQYLIHEPSASLFHCAQYLIPLLTQPGNAKINPEVQALAQQAFSNLYKTLLEKEKMEGLTQLEYFFDQNILDPLRRLDKDCVGNYITQSRHSTLTILTKIRNQVLLDALHFNDISFLIQLSAHKKFLYVSEDFLKHLAKDSVESLLKLIQHPDFSGSPLFSILLSIAPNFPIKIYCAVLETLNKNPFNDLLLFKHYFSSTNRDILSCCLTSEQIIEDIGEIYKRLLLAGEYDSTEATLNRFSLGVWEALSTKTYPNALKKSTLIEVMRKKAQEIVLVQLEANNFDFLKKLMQSETLYLGNSRRRFLIYCLESLSEAQLTQLFSHGFDPHFSLQFLNAFDCSECSPQATLKILKSLKNIPIQRRIDYTCAFAKDLKNYLRVTDPNLLLNNPSALVKNQTIECFEELLQELIRHQDYSSILIQLETSIRTHGKRIDYNNTLLKNYHQSRNQKIGDIILEEFHQGLSTTLSYLLNKAMSEEILSAEIHGMLIHVLEVMSSADLVSLITHPNLLDQNGKTERKKLLELCGCLPKTQYAAFLKQLSTEPSFISEEGQNYLDQQWLTPWKNGHDRSSILQEAQCTLYIQDIKNVAEEKGKIFKNKWAQGHYSAVVKDLKELYSLLKKPSDDILGTYNCSRDELKGYLKEWFQVIGQSYSEALQKNLPEQADLIKSALQKGYNDAYLQNDVFFCSLYLSIFKLKPDDFQIISLDSVELHDNQITFKQEYPKIRKIVESYKEICKESNPLKNDDVCDVTFLEDMFTQLKKVLRGRGCYNIDIASLFTIGSLIQMESYAPIPHAPTSFEDINKYKSNRKKNKAFLALFEQKIFQLLGASRKLQESHLTRGTVSPAQAIFAEVTSELERNLRSFFNNLNDNLHKQNAALDNELDPKLANALNNIQTAKAEFEQILYKAEKKLNTLFYKPKKQAGQKTVFSSKLTKFSSQKDWSLPSVLGCTLLLIFTGGLAIFYILEKIKNKEPIFGHSYYKDTKETIDTIRNCKDQFFAKWHPIPHKKKRDHREEPKQDLLENADAPFNPS